MLKPHKFILLFVLALFVLSSVSINGYTLRASASSKPAGKYGVTATSLNVRKAPSASSSKIGSLKRNANVSVLRWNGNWAYMSYGRLKGYVSGVYLKRVSASAPVKGSSISNTEGPRIVNATTLYVRKGPGTRYGTLGYLKKGTRVTVYNIRNGWSYISYGKKKGYVSAKYLSAVKTAAKPAPTKTVSKPAAAATKAVPKPAAPAARIVTASALNVRSGPGTSYKSVGLIKYGNVVTVQKTSGSWSYIVFGSLKGYVSTSFLINPGQRVICIDPGHGGKDQGASGNGLLEKNINLSIGLKVRDLLQRSGIKVVMTRSNDTFVSLQGRVDIGVKAHANAFVSIHTNSGESSADGIETFYNTTGSAQRGSDSIKMASFIQNRMVQQMGSRDRGTRFGDLHVLRENTLPAILVEVGFITNHNEAVQKLATDKYRSLAANAIYLGILDYYNYKGIK